MKITDLVLIEVSGEFETPKDGPTERNIHPIDAYPEFAEKVFGQPQQRGGGKQRHSAIFLEVRTDEGLSGIWGAVDAPAALVLKHEVRDFVIGAEALETEKIWDALLRWNRHSHGGYFMMAMSALDCALWDLRGKAAGMPVYRLLGGPVREVVPAYASMLGFSLEKEDMQARARKYQQMGYAAQKWFFRWGPIHGEEGLRRNAEMAASLREAVGEAYPLMFDAFHSWDVPYTLAVCERIAEYMPAWLEEPVPCDQVGALARIRCDGGIPIATGEHVYSRWQVQGLLEAEAVDVVQTDPDWCGGISELVKIGQVCSGYSVPLCPHGHSLHAALHVAAAAPASAVPYVEFLINHQRRRQVFMKGDYLEPKDGFLRPPDKPGLGIELEEGKAEERREF